MTRPARFAVVILLGIAALGRVATAAPPEAAIEPEAAIKIAYVTLESDPRYAERRAYTRIALPTPRAALAGARLGMADAGIVAAAVNARLELSEISAVDSQTVIAAIKQAHSIRGVRFFLLDLPAATVASVGQATAELEILLFNVSADADDLRGKSCAPHLLHFYPSLRMKTDALAQYLRSKGWLKTLLLVGPREADGRFVAGFRASANRFALEIIAERQFELTNDPRNRERNNPALLTATARDYDVVVVADADGEFARYLSYGTNRPRPVIGAAGLQAQTWHFAFERFGAPQVNSRFLKLTGGRKMSGADWAAWVAVKAIMQARLRAGSAAFDASAAYLRGPAMKLDGSKGISLNLRPWDNQLRQPVLLTTHDAVIATAPIDGFLHRENTLDTLGPDTDESVCGF